MKDLTGLKFHDKVTVLSYEGKIKTKHIWLCQCDCGSPPFIVRGESLVSGNTKSCGCIVGKGGITHGLSDKTPLYVIWLNMRAKCYVSGHRDFNNYGGRGIYVDGAWYNDFSIFYTWALANGYRKGLTLNRIHNDGPYAPWNCEWTTQKVQNLNKRNNRICTAFGLTAPLTILCEEFSELDYDLVWGRIVRRNWEPERALTELPNPKFRSTGKSAY